MMSEPDAIPTSAETAANEAVAAPSSKKTGVVDLARFKEDMVALTKARLSFLVVVTTFVGFLVASSGQGIDWWLLAHTLIGTTLAALGSSAFNQLMEIEPDSRMTRTADRPLPAKRFSTGFAFGIGWIFCSAGLIHLASRVQPELPLAALLTALTLGIYLFIYTPMKRKSSWNTIVGAVSGGIPPVIGWVAAGGGLGIEALFLFGLLFLWQLPHFVAINWMYREEYIKGGFVMWSNDDVDGEKTSRYALIFSVLLTLLMVVPTLFEFASLLFLAGGLLLSSFMVYLAAVFRKTRERSSARKLFFYTLAYLPLVLALLVFTWK